ncbi:MAG: class I SAM-dependent methyltransferase, partial [Thermoplasmata archaeon]
MKPDFGTCHHSTPKKSEEMRQKIEKIFCPLLLSLYSDDSELEILDAGCGLGFMTSIAAKCFPKSRIY